MTNVSSGDNRRKMPRESAQKKIYVRKASKTESGRPVSISVH